MNFETFQISVLTQLQSVVPQGDSVQLQTIQKNNNENQVAIIKRNAQQPVSQIVYLEPFFHSFIQGIPMDALVMKITTLLEQEVPEEMNFCLCDEWSKVKGQVVFRLVNFEKNQAFLQKVVHRNFLDLAVTYGILFENDEIGHAIAVITDAMLELWGVTEEQLYVTAYENSQKNMPEFLCGMSHAINDLTAGRSISSSREWDETQEETEEMYILTNPQGFYGASALLYSQKIPKLARTIGRNLYILPSSIHEVIITPDYGFGYQELEDMVRQVNSTELDAEDILSNHVYCYQQESDEYLLCESLC